MSILDDDDRHVFIRIPILEPSSRFPYANDCVEENFTADALAVVYPAEADANPYFPVAVISTLLPLESSFW
jgi:hypothetical protein